MTMQNDGEHEVTSLLSPQLALLLGLASLLAAWHFGGPVFELAYNGATAQGTIERVEVLKGEDGEEGSPRGYLPVIAFVDGAGEKRSFSPKKASTRAGRYAKGEAVAVRYLPADPAGTAVIDKGAEMWWTPGLFALFGLLFLFSGLKRLQGGSRAV